MTDTIASKVLLCSVHEENEAVVREAFSTTELVVVSSMEDFEKFLESPPDVPFPLVVCGETISDLSPDEMAQTFRMQYQGAKIFYVSREREKFDRKTLIKNGYDDAFLLPFDKRVFSKALVEIKSFVEAGVEAVYKPVKVIDLQPNAEIDFDVSVFLPLRNKHIKYAAAGEPLDEERVQRLDSHNVSNMYVDSGQISKFYKYSAERLRALGQGDGAIGETERLERLETSVRSLFTGIFQSSDKESSIQEGKEMLVNCKEIVQNYILADKENNWYESVMQSVGAEGDTYTHHSRVSTFAAMFSIALQVGNPEDLATAALFHDLGLGELPEALQEKKYEDMSTQEKELWALHPSISIKLLKMKKIVVPNIVYESIEQHHERYDGSGFPKGVTPPKLKVESMILGMADEFDYLTCAEQSTGGAALKPFEAVKHMEKSGKYDPELIAKLVRLFPAEEVEAAS